MLLVNNFFISSSNITRSITIFVFFIIGMCMYVYVYVYYT